MPSRRQFLARTSGTVAITTTALAGCVGGDGSDGDDGSESNGDGSDDTDGNGDDFPSEPLNLIVPYGTGGGYDFFTRLIAKYLEEEYLDVETRVENIEGSDGRIAINQLIREGPTGYNVQLMNIQSHTLQQISEDVNFDLSEITWYPQVAMNVPALGASKDSGIESLDDFATAVENQDIRIGSQGIVNTQTLVPYFLGELGGLYDPELVLDLLVMFDDRGEQHAALNSGDIQIMGGSFSSLLPFSEDLDLFIAISDEEEGPEPMSDLSTLATEGIDNATELTNMLSPRRVFGGTPDVPDDRANPIRDAISNVLQDEDFLAEAEEADRPINPLPSDESGEAVLSGLETWQEYSDTLDQLQEGE